MGNKDKIIYTSEILSRTTILAGYYSGIILTIITIITFAFALTAVPISGAFAPGGGISYPYLDTLKQFPGDYIWMYPAILLTITYVILMASIHTYAGKDKKVFSQISLIFTVISSVILIIDYFVQFSVVPVSLLNRETEGMALLTQYNPHGIFIALEELGYLMMSLSFIFIAPVFFQKNRLETAIRWIYIISFLLASISLIYISMKYGIDRKDRFEVAIISIDWLVLLINGILLSIFFKKQLKTL